MTQVMSLRATRHCSMMLVSSPLVTVEPTSSMMGGSNNNVNKHTHIHTNNGITHNSTTTTMLQEDLGSLHHLMPVPMATALCLRLESDTAQIHPKMTMLCSLPLLVRMLLCVFSCLNHY
jgi:hypothetical protein